ncbi:hypothetical protein V2G26_018101 [Clonostachys chloroleuca]
MAAELKRSDQKKRETVILVLHPGEVKTEMSEVDLSWEVKGSISPAESVSAMLHVISEKGEGNSGTFFCWDGRSHPWCSRSTLQCLETLMR